MKIHHTVSEIEIEPGDRIVIRLPADITLHIAPDGLCTYVDFIHPDKVVNYFTDTQRGFVIDKRSCR